MQEEVHRFAITAFRKKHVKSNLRSELDDIKGVGPAKRNKLLLHFSSINKIKTASLEELEAVVDKRTAGNIYEYYN